MATIRRWWRERAARDFETLIAEESAKLDELERAWFEPALEGNGEAAGLVLRILERRARLLGLVQPACSEVNVTVDADSLRARALELVTSHAERRQLYDDAINVEGEEPSGRE